MICTVLSHLLGKLKISIKHYDVILLSVLGEDTNIPPLFFPCGSIKREVLPMALRENGKHFLLFIDN